MVKEVLSKIEFERIIEAEDFVVADFYATWCGPCRMLGTVIDEYAGENKDIVILKINVDEIKALAEAYDIHSLPTIMIFKGGKMVKSRVGFISKSAFAQYISENR